MMKCVTGQLMTWETGMSEEEEAAYLAQDLYDAYTMPRRQTYADRSAARAEKVTQQFQREKAQAMAQQKAAYKQKLREQRKWARDRMAELQNQYRAAKEAPEQELVIKTHDQISGAADFSLYSMVYSNSTPVLRQAVTVSSSHKLTWTSPT